MFRVASTLTRSTIKITATKFNGFINNEILYPVIRNATSAFCCQQDAASVIGIQSRYSLSLLSNHSVISNDWVLIGVQPLATRRRLRFQLLWRSRVCCRVLIILSTSVSLLVVHRV